MRVPKNPTQIFRRTLETHDPHVHSHPPSQIPPRFHDPLCTADLSASVFGDLDRPVHPGSDYRAGGDHRFHLQDEECHRYHNQ